MRYEGVVYRPPSEARSLIVQATLGCSSNTCAFCSMYKEKSFRMRELEAVLEDFKLARTYYPQVEKIFIADGDALIMPMERWEILLNTIRELFPECIRVTSYATPKSVLLKTPEELFHLKELGLKMVYMGLESGSNEVLKLMKKGNTAEDIIAAAKKLHQAGFDISVTAINGLGGQKNKELHAKETGRVLSAMKPAYIGLLTLMVEPGTLLEERVNKGEFQLLDANEILEEIKIILENCDCPGSVFRANHASNYLPLKGVLNQDRQRLIEKIENALLGKEGLKPEWMRGL